MAIAGIDEAGKGCVLGPLVIVGFSIKPEDEKKLIKIGVRDSKELTPEKRKKLAKKIEKIGDIAVLKVGPCKIDGYQKEGVNLNQLEAMKFSEIVNMLVPEKVYIDCPTRNIRKFSSFVKKMIKSKTEIIAENFADKKYPVVSAASIIAKVIRDNEIEELRKKYNFEGSGYTSDERTVNWMKNWLKTNKDFPEGLVRKSWITTEYMIADKKQSRLSGFFKNRQ
jgi:ribonuclease HII